MPTEKEYVKLWVSYAAYFEPLSDAEVGRLARGMIHYKSTGTEPKLSGNERFVWPAIRREIDEGSAAQAALSQKRSESGKAGALVRKAMQAAAAGDRQKQQMLSADSKPGNGQGQGHGQGNGHGLGKGEDARARGENAGGCADGQRCTAAPAERESPETRAAREAAMAAWAEWESGQTRAT